MKQILLALLLTSAFASAQVGSAYFNTVRATTGTFGAVTGSGTISQLTIANGTTANATFQLSTTGTLTIDPSGATHRVYIPGEFYTDFLQMTSYGTDTPNMRIDNVTLDTGNGAEFTAPALTTGNIVLMSATGTGSGNASSLRLVNTRTGSGTNVGLTINATGAGAKSIDVESGAINLGSGVTIGTGTAAFTVPTSNGTNGQVLTFDGAGGTSWTTVSGGTGSSTSLAMGTVGSITGGTGTAGVITGTSGTLTASGLTIASGTASNGMTFGGPLTSTGTAITVGGTTGSVIVGSVISGPIGSATAPGLVLGNNGGWSPVGLYAANATNITFGFANAGRFQMDNTTGFSPTTTVTNAYPLGTSAANWLSLYVGTGTSAIEGTLRLGTAGGPVIMSGSSGVLSIGTSSLLTNNIQLAHTTLASGTAATVDFGGAAFQSVTASGTALVLTGTGYPATGSTARSVTLFISAGTSALTLTTGTGWRFVGTGTPSSVAANKLGVMALTATGSTGTTVRGSYSEEP